MSEPDFSDDDVLLAALSEALDHLDPVPTGALRAASTSWEIFHVDGELAGLVTDTSPDSPLVLLREEEADLRTLTFVSSRLTVEIEVDRDRHAVGVLSPPAATAIEVEAASNQGQPLTKTAFSDELGRFWLDLGIGLCRLRIGSGPDAVVTSWFYC